MISTRITTWKAIESICTRVNCVFFDQMSFTATGWLDTCNGGSFGGEIISRRFCQKPPNPAFQLTSRSEFTRPRGLGLKNSLTLSLKPAPNSGSEKPKGPPRGTFTGLQGGKSFNL